MTTQSFGRQQDEGFRMDNHAIMQNVIILRRPSRCIRSKFGCFGTFHKTEGTKKQKQNVLRRSVMKERRMEERLMRINVGQMRVRLTRPSRTGFLRIRCESQNRVVTLKRALERPGLLIGPCCHDGLSAKLIERAGFPFTFMSGFTTSATKLAAPDVGLLTYSEMVDTGRAIHEATKRIPVIGDGDTGYGNPMNVKRTVQGYANAGFAGILIEDQANQSFSNRFVWETGLAEILWPCSIEESDSSRRSDSENCGGG